MTAKWRESPVKVRVSSNGKDAMESLAPFGVCNPTLPVRLFSFGDNMDEVVIESIMAFIAIFSLTSWIPQIARMLERKQTDDFSLWTTLILLFCNASWWLYAIYIESVSFFIQQTLTLVMLICFGLIIIRYRTTSLLFKSKEPLNRVTVVEDTWQND